MMLKYRILARMNHAKLRVGRNVKLGKNVLISIGKNSEISLGDNVEIDDYSRIYVNEGARFSLGEGSSTGLFNYINCGKSIEIGKKVMLGQFVVLVDSKHVYDKPDTPMADLKLYFEPVKLSDDIWVGAHAVILEGVEVGRGAVIGAGAVVTKNVKAFDVVGGVPAKKLKSRR